jgi:hypothetical protein
MAWHLGLLRVIAKSLVLVRLLLIGAVHLGLAQPGDSLEAARRVAIPHRLREVRIALEVECEQLQQGTSTYRGQ